jgi:DNA invertase Pin-like site-specific DNA recombinase
LQRVLTDILREGDTLVIWKLDRLARSLKQLIQTAEDLKGRGIGLVSLTDAIDTSSPGGMLVFHMLGAIAEFERALIRERTVAGRNRPVGAA